MRFSALVFDLDGTLVDSLADIGQAMNHALVVHGRRPHPLMSYRGFVGEGVRNLVAKAAQGAALALEDSLVLAEALAGQGTIERALAEYSQRRTARVAWVQEQTRRRDRTRSLHPAVRNLVLRSAGGRIYRANYRPLLEQP